MAYKLTFYVPQSHLEPVKAALFRAGAGRLGEYDQCCWQVLGRGQFRPSEEANPHIGQSGQLETLDEWRVEMICQDAVAAAAVAALKQAHPYEEPAFDLIRLVDPLSL